LLVFEFLQTWFDDWSYGGVEVDFFGVDSFGGGFESGQLGWSGINALEQEDFKPDLTCEFFSKCDEATLKTPVFCLDNG